MGRSYKEHYKHTYREALELAEKYKTADGIELCLAFSKRGKKVYQDMNRKLYEDTEQSLRLHTITKEEYQLRMDAYSIIENSIAEGCVY